MAEELRMLEEQRIEPEFLEALMHSGIMDKFRCFLRGRL